MTTTELLCLLLGIFLGQLTLLAWVTRKNWWPWRRKVDTACFAKMAELTVTEEGLDHLRKYLRKKKDDSVKSYSSSIRVTVEYHEGPPRDNIKDDLIVSPLSDGRVLFQKTAPGSFVVTSESFAEIVAFVDLEKRRREVL